MSDAVLGAVLVGGGSRRMGADKASLLLEGTPMAHRVRHALFDGGCGAVVLVGADPAEEGAVRDRWPGQGPLGGLATAVAHAAGTEGVEVVVVAACDQPDLPAGLVAELAHALCAAPPEVIGCAARTVDGRIHPFPSAWRTVGAARLVELVDAGERRADAALGAGPVVEVAAATGVLDDLDTPADVARWIDRNGTGDPGLP